MSQDRHRWEERYGRDTAATAASPSLFIVEHSSRVRGRVLDIAAGSGRNALHLARLGCRVDAFDLSLAGLRLLQSTARAENLAVSCVQIDLETLALPNEAYDAVVNVRYLQRSLFGPIGRALKPGGLLLFETFLIDQSSIGSPSNPRFLLARGELRDSFPTLAVLEYEEGLLTTEGSPAYLARLFARRADTGIEF